MNTQCSVCYNDCNKKYVYTCNCGYIICDECLTILIKHYNSFDITCPECKNNIKYCDIIKLLDNAYDLYLDIIIKNTDEYITNNVRLLYPIFNKITEYVKNKFDTIDLIDNILLYHNELPVPDKLLIDLPEFKVNYKSYILTEDETNINRKRKYYNYDDFFQILLNYNMIDTKIFKNICDDYYKQLTKYQNSLEYDMKYNITSKISKFIREIDEGKIDNSKTTAVISKCKKCRFGLIINKIENCKDNENEKYECNACHQKYCSKCLSIIDSSNINHKCNDEEIKTWNELVNNSVACPCCGVRIYKSSGCNEMFCTNCHNNFNWQTGKVLKHIGHNPHRVDWLNNNIHYTNTDISEIEKISPENSDQVVRFCRLLDYHNILMTNYLNFTVTNHTNNISEDERIDTLKTLILSYYNDIESSEYKVLRSKYDMNKFINTYTDKMMKSFTEKVIMEIYLSIIDLIYSSLVKVVNDIPTYLNKEFYESVAAKLYEYDDLLYIIGRKFDYHPIRFLFEPIKINDTVYNKIAFINLSEIGLESTDELYNIIDDLMTPKPNFNKNDAGKYCEDYESGSARQGLMTFLHKLEIPSENIRKSYYLNKHTINYY